MDKRAATMKSAVAPLHTYLIDTTSTIRVNTPTNSALSNILNISFLDAASLDGKAIL